MIPGTVFTKFAKFCGNVSVNAMTFGFLVGSRNFIRFFWVSWEDFVAHGYDCIHCVGKSCTTTAYR